MTKIINVVAAILTAPDNKILIVQRPLSKEFGGYWEFPGGKVETDETSTLALKRELKEELNIDICIQDLTPLTSFTHQLPDKNITFSFYVLKKWQKEIMLMEKQPSLLWIDPNHLSQFQMPEPNVHVHTLLQRSNQKNNP